MTCRWAVALAVCVALVPSHGIAQGASYATASISTTQSYEDDIFAASGAGARTRDVSVRLGPAVEAGYVSEPLTFVARYGFNAERYLDHPALSRALARQDALLELRHHPTRRLAIDIKGSYLETHTPRELNLDSGLAVGRARAERLTATSAAAYDWTPVTRVHAAYAFTMDVLRGGLRTELHDARFGFERHDAARNGSRLDYRFRQFSFGDDRGELSHAVTSGWSRDLTRRMALDLTVGPRFSRGQIRPEFALVVRRLLRTGQVSAGYSRTQATAIGDAGAIEVQRLSGTFVYENARRRITVSAIPAFTTSTLHGMDVSVYGIDLEAVARTRRGVSVVLSSRLGLQRGTLAGRREEIPYRRVSLGLVATVPGTVRARRTRESR